VATKTKSKTKTTRRNGTGGDTPVLTSAPDTTQFTGQFVKVVSGKHKGLEGAIISATKRDKDGVDKQGVLRTRDDDTQRVIVDYKDLELVPAGRR
jgi:hypothetical protein